MKIVFKIQLWIMEATTKRNKFEFSREIKKFNSQLENYFLTKEHEFIDKERPFCKMFTQQIIQNIKENNKEDYRCTNFDEDYFFKSYPVNNYLLLLSNNLFLSFVKGKFAFRFRELKGFNDMTETSIEKINKELLQDNKEVIQKILQIIEDDSSSNNIESTNIAQNQNFNLDELITKVLQSLGERGILTFLGIRTTPGSINFHLPPDLEKLKLTFQELHTKEDQLKANSKAKASILTVGARALCKHSHRSSEGFWPDNKGKESQKNEKAEEMLNKFNEECVWINIHGLPGDIPIVEMRVKEGYGIRWQVDGVFRGFLEPQMEDGHEKGWRH